jgi:hypothetical protein
VKLTAVPGTTAESMELCAENLDSDLCTLRGLTSLWSFAHPSVGVYTTKNTLSVQSSFNSTVVITVVLPVVPTGHHRSPSNKPIVLVLVQVVTGSYYCTE